MKRDYSALLQSTMLSLTAPLMYVGIVEFGTSTIPFGVSGSLPILVGLVDPVRVEDKGDIIDFVVEPRGDRSEHSIKSEHIVRDAKESSGLIGSTVRWDVP